VAAQAGELGAHGGLADPDAFCGAADAAFLQQGAQ
jgi:hypothetical protein